RRRAPSPGRISLAGIAVRFDLGRGQVGHLMADAVTLQVEARDPQKNKGTGTRVARRLRKQGRIPAIVYGHKREPVPISLTRDDVWDLIKRQTHLAQLKIGDATEMVLVREVQWDH